VPCTAPLGVVAPEVRAFGRELGVDGSGRRGCAGPADVAVHKEVGKVGSDDGVLGCKSEIVMRIDNTAGLALSVSNWEAICGRFTIGGSTYYTEHKRSPDQQNHAIHGHIIPNGGSLRVTRIVTVT